LHKDVRALIKNLKSLGFKVQAQGNQHLAVRDSAGVLVHSLPSTPSDWRWYQNTVTELKSKGIITEDPKKAGQRKRVKADKYVGEAPPPLPDLSTPTKEDKVASITKHPVTGKRMYPITEGRIQDALTLFLEVGELYDLQTRSNRVAGHGSVPIMAYVLEAWEAETGNTIPTFHYSDRDTTDRWMMGKLCANRVQDLAGSRKAGDTMSEVTADSLEACLAAWEWHKEMNLTLPGGVTMRMQGNGIRLDGLPEPEPAPFSENGVGAEDESLAQEALNDMGVFPDTDGVAFAGDVMAEADRIADQFIEDTREAIGEYRNSTVSLVSSLRAQLAVEVAAAISDPVEARRLGDLILKSTY
jgi:hypothetical protein